MKKFITVAFIILLLLSMTGCVSETSKNPVPQQGVETSATINVDFIDVGQGNATLVSNGFGNILIDFGRAPVKLATGLKKAGVSHLDYIFVTHPDLDHYGAWKELIKGDFIDSRTVFGEPTFYMPKSEITKSYNTMKASFDKMGIKTVNIDTITQKNLPKDIQEHLTVLWPNPAYSSVIKNKNNNSLTFDIHTNGNDLFITGDIENEVEKVLYSPSYGMKSMEVYEAPHHGSQYSSAPALLNVLKPQIAIISVGKNSYGHPHPNTLRRLEYITQKYSPDKKAHIYRTDMNGDIKLDLTNLKIAVSK